MTRLGSRLPYGEAQEELKLMWGITVSRGAVRDVTLRHGQVAEQLMLAEVERLEREAPPATATPAQLVLCADGAFVQLTSGEWREVKTATFGEFASHWHAEKGKIVVKTDKLSYFSRVEASESFSHHALYEWQQRGGENAQRVAAVNDGARWIQSFIDYHCPDAVRVIDFAHAQSYVAAVGKAVYGEDSESFKSWYAAASKQLGKKPPQRTIADLRLLQTQHDPDGENQEIAQAIQYLQTRLPMIDYPHFRRQQLPIGSGIGESGNKVVMQRRMKQAGMRWAETSLNPMLALRNLICNQRWQTGWRAICQQRLISQRQQRLQPRHLPRHPSPPPLTFASVQVDWGELPDNDTVNASSSTAKLAHPWRNNKWPLRHRY
ncbi:MAG: hypothetical protein KC418_10825 [Anaerolineales bacterium]|nr:hypothetical protein [Anaerolineales bacterium]MCB8952399.1 hypothetical protein [Ardenticatenales bacterium]